MILRSLILITCLPACCQAFAIPRAEKILRQAPTQLFAEGDQVTVQLVTEIDDQKVEKLYAWVSRCLFDNDPRYNNLMMAFAAVFGNLPDDNPISQLAQDALKELPDEEQACGASFSMIERQESSLGAMGAGQWTGQWKTRPHALLDVSNITSVDEWVKTLPRGCKRTLKKALTQNMTVSSKPIPNNAPAPHSSLAHFRCVIEHEVRLLANQPEDFLDALGAAIGRYVETTRMSGEIREYRNSETGKIIAFAHEVRKGKTIRGQWFYSTDEGSKSYVWFHSVHSLVERAIAETGIDVVDLGPSGSDSFSDLKARYGFVSVDDWPAVADYIGPFWCYEKKEEEVNGLTI